jgi:hypothetical protein
MHKHQLINLPRELEYALAARTPYFYGQLEDMGIDYATAHRKKIGRLLIQTSGRHFKPAHPKDATAIKLPVMPSGFDDLEQPIDLMAFDGRRCWFRLGRADHLGDPFNGPVHANPGAWFKAGCEGSVNFRGING